MFEFVRKHNKLMQIALFVLILPGFVLMGIDGYTRMNNKADAAAVVAGEPISQAYWEQAHRQEVERIRQESPKADSKLLDSPQAKYMTLERMVRDRLLVAAAARSHLVVSDQKVASELMQDPFIAGLKTADGRLDMERYRQVLSQQGKTPEMFEAQIRDSLASRQVIGSVLQSGLNAAAVADSALNAYFQRRVVQVARFDPQQLAAKLTVSDAEIEQFYKDKIKNYQLPEQANVEYVVLDLDTIKKGMVIQESELKAYYDQNASRLSGNEERRARHILINATSSASAADKQAAKARAVALQAALVKAPKTFADVARKESQDTGSAGQGGDLGFFARGAMTKPFEDAVFAMKKGDISPVVETEFGFHIIELTDIKAPKTRSFAEMRGELEAQVKQQQAQKKYAEAAELFTNAVFEQSDSLKPAADRLKLEIKTVSNVTRQSAAANGGVLANPRLIASVFSADTINMKRNTEAVEVAANTLVSARIAQYTPARTQELAEVKDKVKVVALQAKAAQAARQDGAEKLKTLQTNPDGVSFAAAQTIGRLERQGLPGEVVIAAMRAETAKLPSYVGVDLGNQGYAIVKVTQVLGPKDPEQANGPQARAQYSQWWTSAESLAYYNSLKERFKVSIKVAKPTTLSEADAAGAAVQQ